MSEVIHERYLPFTGDQLLPHFAVVSNADKQEPERFLSYYKQVATRQGAVAASVEKDERFWVVTALLGLLGAEDRRASVAALLERAFGTSVPPLPGFDTWESALAGELHLRFEANLPSPVSYRDHLRATIDSGFLLRTQRGRAATSRLEGTTKADAVLVAPETGFAVVFEAKVLSDLSTTVTFDARRNQLARLLDVSLEKNDKLVDPALLARDPARTCVVLLTPEAFREDPSSRLYGWLHGAYRSDAAHLHKHLPHRSVAQCESAAERLGWATWEDVQSVVPGALPWLRAGAQTAHHSPSALVTTEGPNTSA